MELKQAAWSSSLAADTDMATSLDTWSENVVEGLKAWACSPTDALSGCTPDHGEALSIIDGALQAVHSALTMYS